MNPKTLRIVFMGTPEFAVPSLRRLVAEGYNVVGAVTVPDKPAGRGRHLRESDVKIAARELGVPVLQPEKFRDPAFLDALQALQPDLGIVIAFKMLPEVVWAMPRLGTFNLHASLLPEYRGAAPINWAIINGERETGITTFLLNHEIDKGAILAQERVAIAPEDNVGTLYERLMLLGAELVTATVDRIAAGDCTPAEQMHFDESRLHPAPKIFKEDCRIDWRQPGERIVNLVRGLSPYPAAWTPIFKSLCTTTHIRPFEEYPLLTAPTPEDIRKALTAHRVLCLGTPCENGKLTAPSLSVETLATLADYVLVEADGSRQLPLKAHEAHEPVIPAVSRQVICVVGASGFGKPIRESVHRLERFCALTGAAASDPVTPEQAAKAILAERLCDTMFLNQIDTETQRPLADRFAAALGGSGLRIAAGSLRAGSGWLYPDIRKI